MTHTRRYASIAVGLCLLLVSWTPVSAVPVTWTVASGGNGHSYELVSESLNWINAKAAAEARGGYLVTLTSAAENEFVRATFDAQLNNFAWIGASDAETQGATEGNWEWVVGPEAGLQFWQNGPPPAGSATPGNFANWGPVEPNNFSDEDAAALNLGSVSTGNTMNGQWGDTDIVATILPAYIVEFDAAAPVPEPSTLGLLALGGSLLALRRRR